MVTAELAWRDIVALADELRFTPSVELSDAQLVRKTVCAQACVEAVDKALELSGGRGFFRRSTLERLVRDVRAGSYHPLPERKQVRFSGRLALGLDPVQAK